MLERKYSFDVKQYSTRAEMGAEAAKEAAAVIRELLAKKDEINMIFAAAPSQNEFLAALIKEEGIDFKLLTSPARILADEGGFVNAVECDVMKLGEPDASGRRRPEPTGEKTTIDIDTIIIAVGTTPNPLIRATTPGLETNKKGCIVVNEDGVSTSKPGVYAGGDAVTGAATVILAMGAGKNAAEAIDEYLRNK